MERNFTLAFFICLMSTTLAFSQHAFSTGLKVEIGMAGLLEGSEHQAPGFLQQNISFQPGLAGSIGVTGAYFFGKKRIFGLSIESLANYASFSKTDHSRFLHEFGSDNFTTLHYQLYNLLLPVKLNYRHKKMTFFAGVIPTWHIFGKTSQHFRWRMINPPTEWFESDGEIIEVSLTDQPGDKLLDGKFFDKPFTLQAVAGLEWQMNKFVAIGLEYANYTRSNKIVRVFNGGDFFGITENYFKYNSLSLSFKWLLQAE